MTRNRGPLLLALLGLLAADAAAGETALASPAPCGEELARNPEGESPSRCLYDLARGGGASADAAGRRLASLAEQQPGNPWPLLYVGYLKHWTQDPVLKSEAKALYRRSAELAARRGMPRAELLARFALARLLRETGSLDEADAEVKRAVRLAEASGDPYLRAKAGILQADQATSRGELEEAYAAVRRIEPLVEEEGSYRLTRDYLFALSKTTQQTGRFPEAETALRRLAALAAAEGDVASEATARSGLATVRLEVLGEAPAAGDREEVLGLAQRALATARRAGLPWLESSSLWLLGSLGPWPAARAHLERCTEVAPAAAARSYCLAALAARLAESDPHSAEAVIHQGLEAARESGDVLSQTYFWHERMRVSWAVHPPARALADSRSALAAIEALRDQQQGSSRQASLFSTWAEDYYWVSGRLLRDVLPSDPAGLENAFGVTERMRARSLIDALGLSRPAPEVSPAVRARRADLFLEIAGVQRRLADLQPGTPEQAEAQAELGRLELELDELRTRVAREDVLGGNPEFATLSQIRGALAADEALLSFQIAPWKDLAGGFAGGSWLLVSTRNGSRALPLPGRRELREKVGMFASLFEARDGSEAAAAPILYDLLLADALAELPAGIRRLVIVPDDVLHRLPFAALRPEPLGEPLAARYEIALTPSATLWLTWRHQDAAPPRVPALVLADPELPPGSRRASPAAPPAAERSGGFAPVSGLGALPFARREGQAVVRHLGGGSELRVGAKASEAFLKSADPGHFGILHFATHASTDDVNPERSYVALARGHPREDGFLQVREISDLRLAGRVVVLSSCESAAGTILRGEGVMGLARSFFQAGAPTVVASLWPLRDDDGAAFFDRFYRHLARGESVAAALRSAQLDLLEDGAPAAAWAGIVVLGDGGRTPLPGGRRRAAPWLAPAALGLIAMAVVMTAAGARARRRRSRG